MEEKNDKPKKPKLVALSPHQSKVKLNPKKSQNQFKVRSVNKSQVDALEQKSNQDKVKQQIESPCKNRKIQIKPIQRVYEKPKQKELGQTIVVLTEKIAELKKTLEKVTNPETRKAIKAEIKKAVGERASSVKAVKRCKSLVTSSKKSRDRIKLKLIAAGKIDKWLFPRSYPGRPRLTEIQEGLPQAIEQITTANFDKSCSDLRRRSSVIRTRISLDFLVSELKKRNFQIERSTTYLRLIPKTCNTKRKTACGDCPRQVD